MINILDFNFSVLISVWEKDDPILFSRAVNSIFDNTLLPSEVILIIDGPIDSILNNTINNLILKYSAIKPFFLDENVGLARALNFGLSKCNYKWIFRADSDDINMPNRFFRQCSEIILDPNLKLIGSFVYEVDHFFNILHLKKVPYSYSDIKEFIKFRNPFNHMTVAFDKDIVISVGGYPNIFLREDYGLWILLVSSFKAINIPEVLVYASAGDNMYRRRGGFKYALNEFYLQKLLYKQGYKLFFVAFCHFFMRFIFFVSPFFIRKFFYKNFLRSKL